MKKGITTNSGSGLSQPHPGGDVRHRVEAHVLRLRWLALVSSTALGTLFLIAVLWLLGRPQPLWATGPHYVAPNGVDSSNCSLSNPCRTIQRAIANASANDEIRVAAGTYTGTVILTKTLTLRGGFTITNWITSDPENNPTYIDAQGEGRVIHVLAPVMVTVAGFHLTGGGNDSNVGIFNEAGTLTLEDNQVYGNNATGGGGGVINNADLTLRRNRIYSNTTTFGGGGVYVSGSAGTVLIEANEIFSNSASLGGGGILIFNGTVTLTNNLIYTNTVSGGDGGGTYIQNGTVRFENNTIYRNYASNNGGGIYASGGAIAITNVLIISNTAVSGGGIYSNTSGLSVNFTDFFGNSPNHIAGPGGAIDPTTIGSSNRITNPLFVSPQTFNLHLTSSSPAIDSGAITTTVTVDYDGEGRPFGAGMDRGADEYTDPTSLC